MIIEIPLKQENSRKMKIEYYIYIKGWGVF